MEIFSSGVSSLVLHVCVYCNPLCLAALVSRGERGIMGACGHYTVIGYPPLHRTGCESRLISTKEEPFIGCSISLYLVSILTSPHWKKINKYFSHPFKIFNDLIFFLAVLLWTMIKKKHARQKRENGVGTRSHFKIKLDCFFPKLVYSRVFCVSGRQHVLQR